MGCCGNKILKSDDAMTKVEKIKSIAEGFTKLAVSQTGLVDFEYTHSRLSACESCDHLTWLKDQEFFSWLAENKIEVIKNLESLEKVSDLPKKPHRALTRQYCMKCKCNIMMKIHSREERCVEGKW